MSAAEPARRRTVETPSPEQAQLEGERRRATVLLADVKGSTALAEQVDVETWVEIMNRVFQILGAEIYRYGGEIDQYRGDGLVAFFGLPASHEDDSERAVLAALAMQDAVKRYAAKLSESDDIELLLRVGVNSGEVIAASVGDSRQHREDTAMGRAVALAARMETACEPGTVLVTEDTYRLVAPLFEWQALGEIAVEGISQPLVIYRPLAARPMPGKGRGVVGLESPLVGRDAEFRALEQAIERLESGIGGIVTVVGEAGIGKSRLVAEVRKRTMTTHHGSGFTPQWVEGRCLSYATAVAYQIWLDMARGLLGVAPDAPPTAIRDALERWVRASCPDCYEDVYPYMARMLSLSLDEGSEAVLRGLGAQGVQVSTFRAVETLVERATRRRPLVLVAEDLHWADPTSLELLERLLPLVDRAPLLLLCILRPERRHGCWRIVETAARDYPHRHIDLRLGPLSAAESETLVSNLLRVEDLPEALRDRILDHAEGNPFFLEEILRSLIDGGIIAYDEAIGRWHARQDVADIPIPDTLHGALSARIDRLEVETKRVLQLASVVGRIFTYPVLSAIYSPLPRWKGAGGEGENALDAHLIALQRAQLIRERARVPEREYIFKHHMTQEAAYDGLLKRERRAYHRQVAEALEQTYRERLEEQLGLLAHHWDRAGEPERAVPYLLRVGEQARTAYANEEAVAYYERALALLDPSLACATPPRTAVEAVTIASREDAWRLEALKGLGQACFGLGSSREAESRFREAIALGEKMGLAPREQARLYYWLGETLFWQLCYEERIRVGERGLALLGDDTESVEAALMNQTIAISYQDTENWEKHLEITYRTAAFLKRLPYSPELRPAYNHAWGVNLCDKNVEQALAWVQELKQRATRHHDLQGLLEVSLCTSATHIWRGDLYGALQQAQQTLELCTRIGDVLHESWSMQLMGMALLCLGDPQQAKAWATRALKAAQTVHDERGIAMAFQFAGLVSLCLGHCEEAVDAFRRAVRVFRETPLRFSKARATCYLGRAHLTQGDEQEAARCFRDALALADQSQLGGTIHWASYTWFPNPLVAEVLSGLEEIHQDREAFRALCRRFRSQAAGGPFVQWYLEPATRLDTCKDPSFQEEFVETLSPKWAWHDPFGDCTYTARDGFEIRAANGRDLLNVNLSAPRLLQPAPGDWVVQTQCVPVSGETLRQPTEDGRHSGQAPAIGGLVLWKDKDNYLRLDMGTTGKRDIYFGGCLDNRDVLIGRGRLPVKDSRDSSGRVFLRLEQRGNHVRALCSADDEIWFTAGTATFPAADPVQVGMHAIGHIDRTVYRGAYPEGTAIRFESFQLWRT